MKKNIGFYPGELMVPKEHLRERFSVVACDQFTSQPEYWNEVDALTEGHPSANHMIFPEVWLEKMGIMENGRLTRRAGDPTIFLK